MAQVELVGDQLAIRLDRADQLWSFRSQLQVPLPHIRGAEVDPEQAVIIHLDDERYARLVIEVDDPWATAATINQALPSGLEQRESTGPPNQ
jgi:hypothetical protein